MAEPRKILLGEDELPAPAPYLHPQTREPVGPDALAPLFPMALIQQEVSTEPWIDIPGPVLDAYRIWRPTPLVRALDLERALGTPARIYYKYEGGSPAGSHKPNTAVPQAYYNSAEGVRRLTTETGAGQWGSALAFACSRFDLECTVYMVRTSYDSKPYRRSLMETWGARVVPSPSQETNAGRAVLSTDPDSPGSLGIAISEAVEVAATAPDTHYSLGSVLNHVLLHQTVIGLELKAQLDKAGVHPDLMIACVGGGSNFGGFAFPLLADKIAGKAATRFVAVEPTAAPTLTKGRFDYDVGDQAGMTPLMQMYTLGADFMPAPPAAGTRARSCHPRGDRRGTALQGGGCGGDDRVQPLRARALRPQGVRRLPLRKPARCLNRMPIRPRCSRRRDRPVRPTRAPPTHPPPRPRSSRGPSRTAPIRSATSASGAAASSPRR